MATEQTNQIASRTYRACEGNNERYWETRKSTGVVLKDGSFLQTYPGKCHFYSLSAWMDHWRPVISDPHFVGQEEREYEIRKKNCAHIPVFAPKLARMREDLNHNWRVIQQRPTAEAVKVKAKATADNFTCPACCLGSGADHRMCIVRAYNCSVSAWEIACGLREASVPDPKPEPMIPGEESFGSRTYRAFDNTHRIATAVVLDDGSICQVWPHPKRNFYSLTAWKNVILQEHPSIYFVGEEESTYRHYYAQHDNVLGNPYELALRKTLEDYGRIIKQRPTAQPGQIPLEEIPAPPPHYLYEAVAELRSKGSSIEFTRECGSLEAVTESFRDFYRAYYLLTKEVNERFTDEAISPNTIRKRLDADGGDESVVAFFDGLTLRVRA